MPDITDTDVFAAVAPTGDPNTPSNKRKGRTTVEDLIKSLKDKPKEAKEWLGKRFVVVFDHYKELFPNGTETDFVKLVSDEISGTGVSAITRRIKKLEVDLGNAFITFAPEADKQAILTEMANLSNQLRSFEAGGPPA